MIVFTNAFFENFGGYAEQPNWIGAGASFEPDPTDDNLDRRGEDDYFRAIVRMNPSLNCPAAVIPVLAAHEFGHLLGGGHTKESGEQFLFTDSHAFAIIFNIFGVVNGSKSILAEGSPETCSKAGVQCNIVAVYSSFGDTNNRRTFETTALSVANYRSSSGGSGCALQAPTNVVGSLLTACSPYPWNQHSVTWQQQCPSQVDLFWIWFSQPDGSPVQLGWSTPLLSTPVFVTGASSRIRIQACGSSGCSIPPPSSYLASACAL